MNDERSPDLTQALLLELRAQLEDARRERDEARLSSEQALLAEKALAAEKAALVARVVVLSAAMRNANAWIARQADTVEMDIDYDGTRHQVPRTWDYACRECVPGGPMVIDGFRCAVHAARAALEVEP